MNNTAKLRSALIFLIFCILFGIIIFNLYIIQIQQKDFYNNLANQQYKLTITSYPSRAAIYDRNRIALTLNKETISAFIEPKSIQDAPALEQFLKSHFPDAFDRWKTNRTAQFLFIKRNLTNNQIAALQKADLKDIKLMKEPHRWYPMQSMAHLIGITDIDNKGLFGIEGLFNDQLSGTPSTFSVQKDARAGSLYFAQQLTDQGNQGTPVTLTIDSNLQFLAYEDLKETVESFKAKEGAALVIDPKTGEILVMVQYPSFDPNNTTCLDLQATKNKAVTESYELGSVMKVFTALAALEEGCATVDEIIDCKNCKVGFVDGFKISTWKAHDKLSFSEVIQLSNNFGVVDIAKRLNVKLYSHYKKLGFGNKTELNWPAEQTGFVNPPNKWSRQSIISLSFGYEVTATLLQLARAFSVFALGGKMLNPRIIYNKNANAQLGKQLYKPENIQTMNEILEKTVTHGTAHRGAIKGFKVSGKTGTANMVINGEYSTSHNTYTFAGTIEKGDYQRLIITFIKEVPNPHSMLYASSVAVPLFEKIAEHCILNDRAL